MGQASRSARIGSALVPMIRPTLALLVASFTLALPRAAWPSTGDVKTETQSVTSGAGSTMASERSEASLGPVGTRPAGAEPSYHPPYPPALIYTTPAEPGGLRAVLQLHAVFLTGFVYYLTTARGVGDWDVNYEWTVFSNKLSGQSFGTDENHFGTNFIGHPLGGTGYYLAARSNRLTIYQSFGFSFAGSLLWEYFGEVREVISMNDTLVTPVAGWAIGESLYQLGAFFDRSAGTTRNRVLGSVFSPLKSFNDWYDGLEPVRVASGFPRDEWHRFDLQAGAALVREDSSRGDPAAHSAEGRFRLRERIVRLPRFAESGRHELTFGDANASGIELEGAVGAGGLTDLSVSTQVVLAGYYARDASAQGPLLWGGGGLIGVGVGFEYSLHDHRRGSPGPTDRVSSVQLPVLVFEHQVHVGEVNVRSYVDVAPSFGGLQSLAQQDYSGPAEHLPTVTQLHGYSFGLGGRGNAELELTWRALELGGQLRAEAYRTVDAPREHPSEPISDSRGLFEGHVGYRIVDSNAVIRGSVQRRLRGSTVGAAHVVYGETAVGLSTAVVF